MQVMTTSLCFFLCTCMELTTTLRSLSGIWRKCANTEILSVSLLWPLRTAKGYLSCKIGLIQEGTQFKPCLESYECLVEVLWRNRISYFALNKDKYVYSFTNLWCCRWSALGSPCFQIRIWPSQCFQCPLAPSPDWWEHCQKLKITLCKCPHLSHSRQSADLAVAVHVVLTKDWTGSEK